MSIYYYFPLCAPEGSNPTPESFSLDVHLDLILNSFQKEPEPEVRENLIARS
jgi:hypothetical protein